MEHATTGYLARAARQPVRWQQWGTEAFAIAARLDRPVLLVVGAEGCRPCTEMDRAWDDPALAALVNSLFVPVRVDRDERPDVARRYQSVVRTLTGLEGYPLTVFLTADGGAFFGGTTFPIDDPLTGRGLRQMLPEVARGYRERRDFVVRQAAQAQQLAAGRPGVTHGIVRAPAVDAAITAVRDELERSPTTVAAIARARAAGLLFTRFALAGDSADLRTARTTVLRLLPAVVRDSAGRDDDPVLLRAALLRSLVQGWAATHDTTLLLGARRVLAQLTLTLVGARSGPLFTDQTAYVAAGMLAAGPTVGDSTAVMYARAVLDTLLHRAYARDLGARHGTVESVRGLLQDQVQLAAACLAAWDATGSRAFLQAAEELMALLERDYADPLGGYYDTAIPDPAAPLLADRSKQLLDDLLPAANPGAAQVLAQLAEVTGDPDYARRATATLEAFAGAMGGRGLWAVTYLEAVRVALARDRLRIP